MRTRKETSIVNLRMDDMSESQTRKKISSQRDHDHKNIDYCPQYTDYRRSNIDLFTRSAKNVCAWSSE